MSESSLATRLPCLCPLIRIQVSVQCVGTQLCPLVTISTNEIFLQIFFVFFVLSPFNFVLSPVSAKQEQLLIFRPQEFRLFLSLCLSLPQSLSNSTDLCHIWGQITGSLKKMVAWTQLLLEWCIQPALCLLGTEGHRLICVLTQNMLKIDFYETVFVFS